MSSVAIVKGIRPSVMIRRALGLIGAEELLSPKDRVLVKPNYVVARHPSTGITTDSRIIESLVEFAKARGVEDIVIGEGGAGDTERAFDIVGIREVATRQGVRLVNLNRDDRIKVKVSDPLALNEVGIAKTALESNCIINVPTLKVHHIALVTLSMKNLMGLILPKSIMHSHINEKTVDLASLFADRVKINVVDGLVGTEVNETSGSPVEMNLVIAGRDMVSVDTVATAVMGINPSDVEYLQIAEGEGLGVANIEDIRVLGEDVEAARREFKLPSGFNRLIKMKRS